MIMAKYDGITKTKDFPAENPYKPKWNYIGQPQGIAPTLGKILGAFKSITTVKYTHGVTQLGREPYDQRIWQRNYYEHIIQDEKAYHNISNYILNNPAQWAYDRLR